MFRHVRLAFGSPKNTIQPEIVANLHIMNWEGRGEISKINFFEALELWALPGHVIKYDISHYSLIVESCAKQ